VKLLRRFSIERFIVDRFYLLGRPFTFRLLPGESHLRSRARIIRVRYLSADLTSDQFSLGVPYSFFFLFFFAPVTSDLATRNYFELLIYY